jgi:hypothetical protein
MSKEPAGRQKSFFLGRSQAIFLLQNHKAMKPEALKSLGHEAGYVSLVTVALVALSFIVFPLFIAFLPIVLIYGCSVIWKVDHPGRNSPWHV